MKLIDKTTGNELKRGDTVTTFRGESVVLKDYKNHGHGSGRVYCERKGDSALNEWFPSVINAEIVD